MEITAVSFDAAGTLVDVDWNPGRAAVECALEAGAQPADTYGDNYSLLLRKRWRDYQKLHLSGTDDDLDRFWNLLTADWLALQGEDPALAEPIMQIARDRLYGPGIRYFALFDDVLDTLQQLEARGVRMMVLSNWDYSLERILRRLGVFERFEQVVASLRVGPEKPDPALFQHALDLLGVPKQSVAHVGDDWVDDVQGAREFGWTAIHLDRGREGRGPASISSLRHLPEVLWDS